MKRFPKLIHVTYETPRNDTPFLQVREFGLADIDEDGMPVAIYRLVSVGKVEIKKRLVPARRRP